MNICIGTEIEHGRVHTSDASDMNATSIFNCRLFVVVVCTPRLAVFAPRSSICTSGYHIHTASIVHISCANVVGGIAVSTSRNMKRAGRVVLGCQWIVIIRTRVRAPENLETCCSIAAVACATIASVMVPNDTTICEFGTHSLSRNARMNKAAAVVDICCTQIIGSDGVRTAFDHSNASSVFRICSRVVVDSSGICASPYTWCAGIPVTKKCSCAYTRKRFCNCVGTVCLRRDCLL
jgi:hypothetical protein